VFQPPRRLQDVTDLSELCKALGDPTRLQIMQLLSMARRALCACELEGQFDLSQPTVSHHLRILRQAGLVDSSRRGTWVFYEVNDAVRGKLQRLQQLLGTQAGAATSAVGAEAENEHG
jgi:ArsR family transcriptional regulator